MPYSELPDDRFRLVARERAQRLRLLGTVPLELRDDLERRIVVRRLEHLDHVVLAERHPDADELPARLLDRPLALLDAVAPCRETHAALGRPLHQRDVVRHPSLSSHPCASTRISPGPESHRGARPTS